MNSDWINGRLDIWGIGWVGVDDLGLDNQGLDGQGLKKGKNVHM